MDDEQRGVPRPRRGVAAEPAEGLVANLIR
jgi:hypothetical protein